VLQRGQPCDAERALDYVKASAQTLEGLMERGHAGLEALQQLVLHHWNVVMVSQLVQGATDDFQRACARSRMLLSTMKKNDISLNQQFEQILEQLDRIVLKN